ncbi:potassium channel family protein [Haloarchaeobius sp. HME9146]|uniref:potassium channel family protein n=1 Tax=Haloarchaeobius sp. HME9146 TaxID=2978732 RepID=UPI0021BF9E97|nr:TrkA C-terminal domain-containing protein [Haloarchaeobius sp. HME9146]MCT9097749.1 TrkA C-terminal domain-containing protein [Haloarchaeobius sp. HME9146]
MATLPVEILYGLYLGLLAGIIPALVSGSLGFIFKYFTGVTVPGLGVVVLATAIAGINGGLMGLLEESVKSSPRILTAAVVVMMLSLWAHSQGDKLGANMPRRFSLSGLRKRTLSAEVVDFVGGVGKVTITPTGPVRDMEGYPPLPADLRETLSEGSWALPADLPLSELETRLTERLKTEYDLADVAVSLDSRARAQITAAPPTSGLSRRVPTGKRAVSVQTLVPTGCARGDDLTLLTEAGRTAGTLLSADSGGGKGSKADSGSDKPTATDGGTDDESVPAPTTAPTTTGGEGRITVAVPRPAASDLLGVDWARVMIQSRGTRREFELVSLLRRSGKRFRKLTVAADGPLAGTTIGEASIRDSYDVAVMSVRKAPVEGATEQERRWVFAPRGSTELAAGDELFVVGRRQALDSFAEVVA